MKTRYIMIPAALVACAACAKIVEQPEQEGIPMTYRAYQEVAADTKTTVQNGGTQVFWESADEIKVFFKNSSGRFVSQNSEPVEVADFSGNLSILVGASEGAGSSNLTWGLYPYREDAAYDGEYVTTTLPASQTGRAGSFAKNTHISLARSAGNELTFCNVTGGLRFSLTQEGISSVTFRGNDGEALAGTIKMSFEDGVPAISEVSVPQTMITLTATDGGTFQTGKWYYIETIPVALTKGFTMVFTKGGETATLNSTGSVSVLRGIYGSLANADEGLEFKYNSGTIGEAVDLGLSVKWASWNVGASKPEEYGDYFAWGETEPKSDYSWTTYNWSNGSETSLTKYCPTNKTSYWGGPDSPDGKTILDFEDDAACANWGGNWRMPTDEEWKELRDNSTWTWTDNYNGTGIAGRVVTSNKAGYEDRSIFLSAAGYGQGLYFDNVATNGSYWSSSLYAGGPGSARYVLFHSDKVSRNAYNRFYGLSVRPVYDDRVHVTSVTLDRTTVEIIPEKTIQLTATVLPGDAFDKTVFWSSSHPAVASVNEEGLVTSYKEGSAIITVTSKDGGLTATCTVKVIVPKGEAVDLGLSVKWASYNVGASKPEEYGYHFAWGETEPKVEYTWFTYKWCNGDYNKLTKYCPSDRTDHWAGSGSPDKKTGLDIEDDAARANWGGFWRMPTAAEWDELINNCTYKWTSNYNGTGIKGYIVTSKIFGYTNKSIFLPAAGSIYSYGPPETGVHGGYWSSSTTKFAPDYACLLRFTSSNFVNDCLARLLGHSVRPVTEYLPDK